MFATTRRGRTLLEHFSTKTWACICNEGVWGLTTILSLIFWLRIHLLHFYDIVEKENSYLCHTWAKDDLNVDGLRKKALWWLVLIFLDALAVLFTFWISSQCFIKVIEHKNTCPLSMIFVVFVPTDSRDDHLCLVKTWSRHYISYSSRLCNNFQQLSTCGIEGGFLVISKSDILVNL